MHRTLVRLVPVLFAALPLAWGPFASQPRQADEFTVDTSIDLLLGNNHRRQLADALNKKEFGDKSHTWDQYAEWGRNLVTRGRVDNPPVGPSPSALLAETYRCVHCHNLVREDAKLTVQDPELRERAIRLAAASEPAKRDGTILGLTPGTTFFGAVNRESFYNGHYERYRRLRVANGERMNPERLADAIQVCCSYCSAGRLPEAWELDSLLAFFWTLELRFKDLDLPEKEGQALLELLISDVEEKKREGRQALRRHYLLKSRADATEEPHVSKDATDSYADGTAYTGEARRGKLLYRSACAGCHGGGVHPQAGAELVAGDKRFHEYVWKGTERDGLYMPLFTAQRLSRQQAADIRAYLHSLRQSP
jgi:hypothetical protein